MRSVQDDMEFTFSCVLWIRSARLVGLSEKGGGKGRKKGKQTAEDEGSSGRGKKGTEEGSKDVVVPLGCRARASSLCSTIALGY